MRGRCIAAVVIGYALGQALGARPLAAQMGEPPPAPPLQPSFGTVFFGAAVGSAAGVLIWAGSGRLDGIDGGEGILLAGITSTVGSALGAWIVAGAEPEPGFGAALLGSLLGGVGGAALGTASAIITREVAGSFVITYPLGQGITTAWVMTRHP